MLLLHRACGILRFFHTDFRGIRKMLTRLPNFIGHFMKKKKGHIFGYNITPRVTRESMSLFKISVRYHKQRACSFKSVNSGLKGKTRSAECGNTH
jgi:hypothetical protein